MHLRRTIPCTLGLAAVAAAQNSYNTTFNPQDAIMYALSADPTWAFLNDITLAQAPAEGSDSGEVLYMANGIEPSNFESVYTAMYPFAQKLDALAQTLNPAVDPTGVRQMYFHAATYYRQSVYPLIGNPNDTRLYTAWTPMLNAFNKAAALLDPPGQAFTVKATNSSVGPYTVPAYFFKGSTGNAKLPTIIAGTGYDGAQQDIYHLACGQILARGINCVTYEGPGQPTVRRQQGLGFIPDWNTAVTPIVDYLLTRPDVDTSKIALLGDSFGGTLAPLAAAKEHRLSALILNDGLPNLRQALIEAFPTQLVALYNQSQVAEFNDAIASIIPNASYPTDFRTILAYTLWAFPNSTPYEAWGKLGNVSWGLQTAAQIGNMPVYVAKGQGDTLTLNEANLAKLYLETGRLGGKNLTYYHEFLNSWSAGLHTGIGAESQVWASIMSWLSQVWGGYKFGNGVAKGNGTWSNGASYRL